VVCWTMSGVDGADASGVVGAGVSGVAVLVGVSGVAVLVGVSMADSRFKNGGRAVGEKKTVVREMGMGVEKKKK
jgi:hypothetical protein